MNNSFKFLPLILGLIVVSCSEKEIEPTPIPQERAKMKVTMTSLETKTAMVREGNTFTPKWTAGDQLGVFVRAKGAYVDKNISTGALTEDTESATFTAEVTAPQEDGTYEFYTYYPYSELDDNDYKSVRVAIPSEQHPANGSFDPKADILTGYPKEESVTAGQTELEGLSIQFLRKSSIVRFLIPQCEGFDGIDGETPVSEVTVYFDKNVTGVANWNITDKADLALEEAGASNAVTLKYTEGHKITDPLWISIAPVSGVKKLTFAFKVADNAYLYAEANLPGEGASFAAGKMKKYDIPINAASWSLKSFSNKYVKVTDTPASWLGKYLIVGKNDETLYACDQSGFGSWGNCSVVTAESDGSISSNTTIDGYAFEVVNGTADGTYAFKTQDNKYLSSGAVKNCNVEESQSATKTDFILTCADEGLVTVESNNNKGRYLRYNHNNGSGGLRFYDGTTGVGVSLYKQVEDYSEIAPVIANPAGIPDEVAKEGVTDATFTVGIANLSKYSVTIPAEGGVDGTVVTAASVSYAGGTATVTYSVAANTGADRDGWIKVQAGTTEKKVDIHQATGIVLPEITPVADQNITYEASNAHTFDVTITNVGSYAVTCATDGTVVTEASAALKAGDVYTVTYTVTENEGETQRDGTVTVKCSTVSQVVNIKQSYNSSLIKTYVLTELANIASDDIVIPIGNEIYAMSNDNGTTSGPSAVSLSDKISDNKIVGKIADNLLWNISGNATAGYTFYPNGVTDKYLYCNTTASSGSNGNMRVGSQTKDIRNVFTLNDNILETKDSYTTRYLSIYTSGPDWRGYTNKVNNPASMTFYVLDDGKIAPTITSTDKSITTLGSQDVSEMFSSNSDGVVSYTVSGGILSGTIFSALEPGDYTITFKQEATTTYKTGQKAATVHVSIAPTLEATIIEATGNDAEKKIIVDWVDVDNASSYTVHCNSSSFNVEPDVKTYEITGLEYAVEYDIYVTASAEGYYSSDSEHVNVILTDPTKQDLVAPVISASVSGTTVTVNWTDVENATSYFVECGEQSTTVNAGVQTAQFTCTAGSYEVFVTAKADGFNDGKSEVAVANVYEQLAAPANFASGTKTSTTISVSWSAVANASAGYQVSKDGTNWTDVNATTYTFEGLTASTQYDLYVRAKAVGYYTVSPSSHIKVTTEAASTKSWKKVTDASALKAGDKLLIVATVSGHKTASYNGTFAADGTISNSIMGKVSVTISDNEITDKNGAQEFILGGSSGNWTLSNGSNLLGATAAKKVAWGSGTTTWSISISSESATIQNNNSGTDYGKIMYNRDSPRFTTYTSNPSASMALPMIFRYE